MLWSTRGVVRAEFQASVDVVVKASQVFLFFRFSNTTKSFRILHWFGMVGQAVGRHGHSVQFGMEGVMVVAAGPD